MHYTKWKFKVEEIKFMREEKKGFCVKCGMEKSHVEPDFKYGECSQCKTNTVYGVYGLIESGYIEVLPFKK